MTATNDHNKTNQTLDSEESLWNLHHALGGPERANKEVRKHRAQVMAICIVLAVVAVAVAVSVESAGGPRWFLGVLGALAMSCLVIAALSVRSTIESPSRLHDPRV